MGKRFLREQILRPLQDLKEIQERQKYIEILKHDSILLEKIQKELKYIVDLDALLGRLSL
jgi:DNA mismatch repair ATPase MutS